MNYQKLDPAFKAKWVAALRSGAYPQTKGKLRDPDGYCCLGVGCDVWDPGLWEASVAPVPRNGEHIRASYVPYLFDGYRNDSTVPEPLRGLWGLDLDAQVGLTTLNDLHAKTFPEIADWIEKNL